MLACSQQYENQQEQEEYLRCVKRPLFDPPTQSSLPKVKPRRCFAAPKSESDIAKTKNSAIPTKTREDTKYCITNGTSRASTVLPHTISPINDLSGEELAHHLCNFIFEVRKQDGSEFPPNTLHHLVSGIQRHLPIDIFKDREFAEFRV